jgi:hypothetical protein
MIRLLALVLLLPGLAQAAPAFEHAALRFFEQADGPILPVARRIYTTRFDATRTRRLGVEFVAGYAAPETAATVPLACTLTKPDGSTTPAERPMDFQFFAGKTGSQSASLLWGAADERDWPAGSYAVECRVDGEPVAKASFDVVRNPPEVADGEIRVKAIRIFAVEEQLPPIEERHYATGFAADRTRRIGVELEFSHAPLGRAARVPVDCWFFWPDGQTSPPLVLGYEPQPTWAGGYSAGAMGFAEPGGWTKGVYTVSCAIGGQPAAIERFDVE